jgi:hypothetical protein
MHGLPLNESSFEKIRTGDLIYVDKTSYILKLINTSVYAFLSRPRRFGKSLTVSTLAALFKGQKELFRDLYIYDKWDFKKFPVLWFDFNGIAHDTPDNLKKSLEQKLYKYARQYELTLSSDEPLKGKFSSLIENISLQQNVPVVVLIDEYDKPILDHLGLGEKRFQIALENREILRSFFGIFKEGNLQQHIRFVFVTGVSTFSKVSIFSEWNNLTDLSTRPQFATFLGYTDDELTICFDGYIYQMAETNAISTSEARDLLKKWYNGYRFSPLNPNKVYNPISILNTFTDGYIGNYWFTTGTPSFLVNLMKQKNYSPLRLEYLEVFPEFIYIYDMENLPLEVILYQAGYLTIKDTEGTPVEKLFLGYPNKEVKLSFNRVLLTQLYHTGSDGVTHSSYLVQALHKEDWQEAKNQMDNIFALIPCRLFKTIAENQTTEEKIITEERFYQTIIYTSLCASGYRAEVEVITCGGFADLVLQYEGKIFIFEIKTKGSASQAIRQIREKGYDRKYTNTEPIYLIGLVMDTQKRRVREMKVAKL